MGALVGQVSAHARELTVLLVEDDPVQRNILAARLGGVFKELLTAGDGLEGLALFRARSPQIVLTDHRMPELSGIGMMEEIRKTDARVPFVFITSTMDTALLVRAINLGVSAIIPKPVEPASLFKAIAMVVGVLENDMLQRKNLEQELALLQYRDKYHEYQQELAFRKELDLLENDYLCRTFKGVPGSGQGEWLSEVNYRPHDIMCGDSYGLRRLPDGSQLVFLADAMGKGLAAALTSSLAAYAFNLQVDALAEGGAFAFEAFVAGFTALIRKRLLEEEVFSCSLAWLPATGPRLELAAFGMPPVLMATPSGLGKFRCNNPPLSAFGEGFTTSAHDLGGVSAILLYTDGLNEAVTRDGSLFRDRLDHAFRTAIGGRGLWEAFLAEVPVPDDDVTCLFLTRVDGAPRWRETLEVPGRLEAVEEACQTLEARLEAHTALEPGPRAELAVALREAMVNAYEHGCLGLGSAHKQRLLEEGDYHEQLEAMERRLDRTITVTATATLEAGGERVALTIQDPGAGFSPPRGLFGAADNTLLCGRGLRMIRKFTDAFQINDQGNAITLMKTQPRGNHAD